MKKCIAAAAIAAGYIILCRLSRGYWNISGDLIVIAMAAISWAVLRIGIRKDMITNETEELPVKVATTSGGISKIGRTCNK